MPHWIRVINNGKYLYVLVNNASRPVQFNKNTGYFKAYSLPSTKSLRFNVYLSPDQPVKPTKQNNVYGTESNPLNLSEVTITPTKYVGILRAPDDHLAALARDRAVDAKINSLYDLLLNFFVNLMTGGMYSAVDLGADNLAKGNYVKGTALIATPVMFGPAESAVANLTRFGVGAYDLLNDNGVRKTYKLARKGDWSGAAKSAAGDVLNLGMTIGGGYNLGKYNIPSFVLLAARNGNNTARSYLINKQLNQNIKNFDGTVGEEYFLNPVPYRWIRVSETPEVGGLQEMGKNVTTTDAYNIHVPTNDWRMSHIKDFNFKDGQWYKKPKKKFSLTKFGLAHGDASLAAYGKVWNGNFAYSGQFPRVRLEGEAYNKVYRGFDPNTGYDSRTNFVLLNVDNIPIGSRIGFHTGEMPMENLLYFLLLPNGRWAIKGLILPNKNLYIDTSKAVEPTSSTIIPLKNLSLLDSPEYRLLLLLRIWEEFDSGRKFLGEYLKSPNWGERASKHMSRQEAFKLGHFESLLLSSHNPPEGFNPLYSRLKLLNNGASGQSVMPYKSKQSYREIQIDPNNAVAPRYTGVHESAHMSNLNYTPFNGYKHYKELFPEELQPLLDKLLANAKKLADQLEIDPKRYKESVDFVAENRNISTLDAKNLIDNWILYLKDPGEARARGLAAVAYSRTMHTKDIPKTVDGGLGIFTKESLDNLYKNIFSIGAPIGVGLYATQN